MVLVVAVLVVVVLVVVVLVVVVVLKATKAILCHFGLRCRGRLPPSLPRSRMNVKIGGKAVWVGFGGSGSGFQRAGDASGPPGAGPRRHISGGPVSARARFRAEKPNCTVLQRDYAGIAADGGRGAGRRFRDIGPGMHGAGPGGRVRERA